MLRLLGLAVICVSLGAVRTAGAHEFPPPLVSVSMSAAAPRGHPDLQTIFDVPTGAGFDQIRIMAPPGSSIAADPDIPNGTIVGRLDAEATTNAITLPDCTSHVEFTVPIRKETADPSAASYPAYLRDLAPGQHRLRLVADVSPSPAIPILINYLFDVDPTSKSMTTTVLVGDPQHPPEHFTSCTPQKSTNTLFGITPAGTPLLTSPSPLPEPKMAFKFSFTSRPDANGQRHVQSVEAFASVAATDRSPLAVPMTPPPSESDIAAPSGIQLTLVTDSGGFYIYWAAPAGVDAFDVVVTVETPGETARTRVLSIVGANGFDVPRDLLPRCPGGPGAGPPDVTITVAVASVTQMGKSLPAKQRFGPEPGCAILAHLTGIVAPNAGSGPVGRDGQAAAVWLAVLGTVAAATGVAMQVRRRLP